MPRRDSSTGQFVAGDEYDDYEVATFAAGAGLQAVDLAGGTGFEGGDGEGWEGIELIDYDEYVDRNEELELISAYHVLSVYQNSTASADGTVTASVEISSSPSRSSAVAPVTTNDTTGSPPVSAGGTSSDSIDTLGRPLHATAGAPFSDTTTGVGGGGSAGEDSVEIHHLPVSLGRFHPRDELFFNGYIKAWNIADAGIHATIQGQHVYGIISD